MNGVCSRSWLFRHLVASLLKRHINASRRRLAANAGLKELIDAARSRDDNVELVEPGLDNACERNRCRNASDCDLRQGKAWSTARERLACLDGRIGRAKIQRDVIARGVFTSVADLGNKLRKYIRAYSKSARPFRWTHTDPSRRIIPNQIAGTSY